MPPATRHDAAEAAKTELRSQVASLTAERQEWIRTDRMQLDATQYRFEESIADRPIAERRQLLDQFDVVKAQRREFLAVADEALGVRPTHGALISRAILMRRSGLEIALPGRGS